MNAIRLTLILLLAGLPGVALASPGGLPQLRREFEAFRDAANERLGTLEGRVDSLEGRMTAAEARLDDAESRLASAELRLDDAEFRLDSAELRLDDAESRLDEVEAVNAAQDVAIADLEVEVADLAARTPFELVDRFPGIDAAGGDPRETLRLSGYNLQIVNDSGSTLTPNGLGNIVIGYDTADRGAKTGSHVLVVGDGHAYMATSGIVSGLNNAIGTQYSHVIGGVDNSALEREGPVVIGGRASDGRGEWSAVLGGEFNMTTGDKSVITGGFSNTAGLSHYVIVGGEDNDGDGSTCSSGGGGCWAGVVVGGRLNTAYGAYSVTVGGSSNTVSVGHPYKLRLCSLEAASCP